MSTYRGFYLVTYQGVWLGGKAVVIAHSDTEAIELVRQHEDTIIFQNVRVERVKGPVLYNDNGDY